MEVPIYFSDHPLLHDKWNPYGMKCASFEIDFWLQEVLLVRGNDGIGKKVILNDDINYILGENMWKSIFLTSDTSIMFWCSTGLS